MQRKVDISIGEFYHLYNRGVEKRKIFSSKKDYERFLRLLYLANGTKPIKFDRVANSPLKEIDRGEPLVAIGAYVLMPNHFHILVREIIPGGTSAFMEKLATGYVTYFNKLHERVGPLFQGTYKAQHAANDEHLKYLYAYIHLNPIKLIQSNWKEEGIKDVQRAQSLLAQNRYSSYPDYIGQIREESGILDKEHFPGYFAEEHSFEAFLEDWLTLSRVTLDK